ncbi:MAG TPA: hypothetical protein VGR97_01210 [Candidatus Acidoferrales bacterium]|nr:hypothetical protein [Candidatus Acidoferrales bacterium]
MIPQVHFNFGPTSFDRFYQLSLPLIPGGVFIGGLLLAHPTLGFSLRDALGLSQYAELLALIFAAYVVGFVLFASSAILAGIASGIAQGLVFRSWKPTRWSWLLSQCTVWRKVTAKFLGEELAPKLPENQPASSVMEKIKAPMKDLADKQQHDALWEEWYRILQDYLLRDVPVISNDMMFIGVGIQATGWAGVALCFVNASARHWAVYVLASVFILFGALFPFLATLNYLGTERLSYWDFTARLLAEVRTREMQKSKVNHQEESQS